jgi:hypothetical protein
LGDLLLVGHCGRPAVDADVPPQISMLAETFAEASRVPRGVPEREPEYFGIFIREGPFRDLPDNVVNGGGLVKNDDYSPALIVESCERLGVVVAPYDGVHPPSLFVSFFPRDNRRSPQLEPVPGDKSAVPFRELRPSLCFELRALASFAG